MVLGKLPVPGRPTIWIIVGQGPTVLAVGAGGGCLDIFILIYPFSPLSPCLWETARYRLKYCLKGPLNPNQPTNQHRIASTTELVIKDARLLCITLRVPIRIRSAGNRKCLSVNLTLNGCLFESGKNKVAEREK